MGNETLLQLGVGGAIALGVLKIVLDFLQGKNGNGKGTSQSYSCINCPLRQPLGAMQADIAEIKGDIRYLKNTVAQLQKE